MWPGQSHNLSNDTKMRKISEKQINEAAKAHAKGELGENQFKSNPDAVKSITGDFKSGIKWYKKIQIQNGAENTNKAGNK